jgi:hypothetical protein
MDNEPYVIVHENKVEASETDSNTLLAVLNILYGRDRNEKSKN